MRPWDWTSEQKEDKISQSIACSLRRREEVLNRRDAMRLREREHRHSHRGGGDRTLESSPEDVPVEEEAEPTKRKAEETTRREHDIENQPSKKQRLETVTCEGDVGDSLMPAMERVLNQCSPKVRYGLPARATGDCTHQDVTSAINVLTMTFLKQRLRLMPSELSALCAQTISTANNRIES